MVSRKYENQSLATYWPPTMKFVFVSTLCVSFFLVVRVYMWIFLPLTGEVGMSFLNVRRTLSDVSGIILDVGVVCAVVAFLLHYFETDRQRLEYMLKYRLFSKNCGNPLGLKHDAIIPSLKVSDVGYGQYRVTIDTSSCSADTLVKMPKIISAGLVGKYAKDH